MRETSVVRRRTSTSGFGVSRREGHDASGFYGRFTAPDVSVDDNVGAHRAIDDIFVGDSRDMQPIEEASVALVVTSPPYFAGKEYEESLGQNGVPGTYFEYLALLKDVFSECKRVLEPGGVFRVVVPDNVQATVALPAGQVRYAAAGAGDPRYEGTRDGRAWYLVGSGESPFAPS